MLVRTQLAAGFLSFLLVLSALGLPGYAHWCSGNFEGYSLLVAAEHCSHEVEPVSHAHTGCCTVSQEAEHRDCCSDELIWSVADQDLALGESSVPTLASLAALPLRAIPAELLPEHAGAAYTVSPRPPPPRPAQQRRALSQTYLL